MIDPATTKPIDEAGMSYMMSLMNEKLIDGDKKMLKYKKKGRMDKVDFHSQRCHIHHKIEKTIARVKANEPSA